METQMMNFSANAMGVGMPDFFWGSMWMFPVGMLIVMLVMAFLICGRGTRRFCGHIACGARGGGSRETPLEILRRRYAVGEITKEEFERIQNDLRNESAA